MAEVSLAIHGKTYGVACDDGQESRVTELGRYVDTRLREIADLGAATNDSHLLVLTSLVLADEVYDVREAIAEVQAHAQAQESVERRVSEEDEKAILNAIHSLSQRIDSVSDRLDRL